MFESQHDDDFYQTISIHSIWRDPYSSSQANLEKKKKFLFLFWMHVTFVLFLSNNGDSYCCRRDEMLCAGHYSCSYSGGHYCCLGEDDMVVIVAEDVMMCAGRSLYSGGSGCVLQGSALPAPSGRFHLWTLLSSRAKTSLWVSPSHSPLSFPSCSVWHSAHMLPHMHACSHIHIHVHTCLHTCTCKHIHTHALICMHAHDICMHMHRHKHTHTRRMFFLHFCF